MSEAPLQNVGRSAWGLAGLGFPFGFRGLGFFLGLVFRIHSPPFRLRGAGVGLQCQPVALPSAEVTFLTSSSERHM
jgi:hypothetical protein